MVYRPSPNDGDSDADSAGLSETQRAQRQSDSAAISRGGGAMLRASLIRRLYLEISLNYILSTTIFFPPDKPHFGHDTSNLLHIVTGSSGGLGQRYGARRNQ